MKNLRIITLTAICMMAGMSLLEAKGASQAVKKSMKFTNNTANTLSIECKSEYRKIVNGATRMRHHHDTLIVAPGKSETWNYHTEWKEDYPKYIKIKDTVNGKHFYTHDDLVKKFKTNNTINADYSITAIDSKGKITTIGKF